MVKKLIYEKPMRPIDYLPDQPLDALEKIWVDLDFDSLVQGELPCLFYMALSHDMTVYHDDNVAIRAKFIEFYVDFLPFIEAIFCYNVRTLYYFAHGVWPDHTTMPAAIEKEAGEKYSCRYLTDMETLEPSTVISQFFIKYPIDYVRRELFDFIDAAQLYSGRFTKCVSSLALSDYYLTFLTLAEAGFALVKGRG